jgi:GR25 family glycosyltransferase involved in LPS biosynthesis
MKYFCINMETATERRAQCKREFAEAGIDVAFVRGLDSKINNIGRLNHDMAVGMIGCFVGHWRIMDEIDRYDHGVTMIMEDDVKLEAHFKTKLDHALSTLPDDWQLACIGWYHGGWPTAQELIAEPVNSHWLRVSQAQLWGTHAYMVNGRKGAQKILSLMEPIRTTVDSQLYEDVVAGRLCAYLLCERLAWQSGAPSQIS